MKMKTRLDIRKKIFDQFEKEHGRGPSWPAETTWLSEKASKICRKKQGIK